METFHKFGIGSSQGFGGGTDTGDPKAAPFPFEEATSHVGEVKGPLDRLNGVTVFAAAVEMISFGQFENLISPPSGLKPSSDS